MKETSIRLHQLNPVVGDIERNCNHITAALVDAREAGHDLLIVPELAVCGYPPMDLLERAAFLEAIQKANDRLIASTDKTALLFGTVTLNRDRAGRPCFNSAIIAHEGKKIDEIHKSLLPTYDVFDEDRYFERNDSFKCVSWNGIQLGITICEDIWWNESSVRYHTYPVNPVKKLVEQGAEGIINISASPFTVEKSDDRQQMLKNRAIEYKCPIFYVNQVGANTDLIFDGDSMAVNAEGQIKARAALFDEAFVDVSWEDSGQIKACKNEPIATVRSQQKRIFEALRTGLLQYVQKTGITSQVVIGLSGGIDSALVACIATEALDAQNVMGVAMPSAFSSDGSISDAEELAQNLGIEFHQLPIKSLYDEYLKVLKPLFEDTEFGVAEENLQSRARGMLLMAIANKFNRFVLNTGNKSELATGYCTLYGDMNGALAVISDLYKTEVYQLAQWLNDSYYKKEVIPQEVLQKPPSAELRPNQKDSDRLPAYDILDKILRQYVEKQRSLKEITSSGFDENMVKQIIRLVKKSEHKRYQAPPGLKIHQKAFGRGRRWLLTQGWDSL